MDLSGSDRLPIGQTGCVHVVEAGAPPLSPWSDTHPRDPLPPEISSSQFDSGVLHSFVNVLQRPGGVCLLGSPVVSVLPTRKVHSENTQASQASGRHTLSHQSNSNQCLYGCKRHSPRAYVWLRGAACRRPPWAEDTSSDLAVHVFTLGPQEFPFRLEHGMTPGLLPPC